jgi:anaerobic ribonucleoside-triphosphate reductase
LGIGPHPEGPGDGVLIEELVEEGSYTDGSLIMTWATRIEADPETYRQMLKKLHDP